MTVNRQNYRHGKDGYVSEFTNFIESLLGEHPEIVADQYTGWSIYWEPQNASRSTSERDTAHPNLFH